jgi:hypothetical protein
MKSTVKGDYQSSRLIPARTNSSLRWTLLALGPTYMDASGTEGAAKLGGLWNRCQ